MVTLDEEPKTTFDELYPLLPKASAQCLSQSELVLCSEPAPQNGLSLRPNMPEVSVQRQPSPRPAQCATSVLQQQVLSLAVDANWGLNPNFPQSLRTLD